jgi:hypothetical protein
VQVVRASQDGEAEQGVNLYTQNLVDDVDDDELHAELSPGVYQVLLDSRSWFYLKGPQDLLVPSGPYDLSDDHWRQSIDCRKCGTRV